MDIFSAIIVVVPLITPIAADFGVDPVHLAIIFLTNLEIGYITPPVGINLFISSFRFNRPITELYRASFPFLILLVIADHHHLRTGSKFDAVEGQEMQHSEALPVFLCLALLIEFRSSQESVKREQLFTTSLSWGIHNHDYKGPISPDHHFSDVSGELIFSMIYFIKSISTESRNHIFTSYRKNPGRISGDRHA